MIGYDTPAWGHVDPRWHPQPPTVEQRHDDLIDALDEELAGLSIEQQTVHVTVHWTDQDGWAVYIQNAPPTGLMKANEGRIACLVDFDQYEGSIEFIRRMTAESLAEDLMDQVEPDWRTIREFGPDWDADPPDYD